MRILFLITGLGGGGAERVVVDLADQMYMQGHQVKIAYLKGNVVLKPEHDAIELIYLGLESLTSSLTAFRRYHTLLNRFSPDVVHAHMVHANIFARLSRIFKPINKLICTAHSNNEGGKLRMLAYRYTHSWADVTTNVSMAAAENFEHLGAVPVGEILTVYNGIDLQKFKYRPDLNSKLREQLSVMPEQKIILAVGRLHEAKDYPNLIRSFHTLKSIVEGAQLPKLFIAGDGEQHKALLQLIEDYQLQQDIHLLGRRDDIEQLMSVADYFVLSSSFEGFGLVVAEAMACETFVIATDCGGVREVMGDTGILVPTANSHALANALLSALSLAQNLIDENNLRARQRVEKMFSLDGSVQKWLEIYAS
ncbi:glycosyltransferase [Acinetobacter rudis]|uniref:glycosyltransferase n=1 Tax=Acinetobacter rudis TaxID=632955 RepID=UPI003342026B